jgi:hypothetical protein
MPRPGDPVTGGPRPLVQTRIESTAKAWVLRRAASETEDDNVAEIARRLILYALPRMPHGWLPAEDQHDTVEKT